MKNGDESIVMRPLSFGWQTSDTYITAGAVVIPIPMPIIARPIISWMKKSSELSRLEKPMMSHEIVEMKFRSIIEFRRPILSAQ